MNKIFFFPSFFFFFSPFSTFFLTTSLKSSANLQDPRNEKKSLTFFVLHPFSAVMKDGTCRSRLPLALFSLVTPLLLSHSPRSANPAICPSLSGSRGIPEACTGGKKRTREWAGRQGWEKKKKKDRERPPFSFLKGCAFLDLNTQSRERALTDMLFSVKTLSARLSLIPLYYGVRVRGSERVRGGLLYLRGRTQTEQ